MLLQIGRSSIFCPDSKNHCLSDYENYIISIISHVLATLDITININIGNNNYHFNNNRTLKIKYNIEHTLVLAGGRDVPSTTPFGTIPTPDHTSTYLVRIDNIRTYDVCDIIIDYSIPNMINVKSCEQYDAYSKKMIYISPNIYNTYHLDKNDRTINVLTTFINTNQPRRKALLETMERSSIPYINVHNCFDKHKLQEILCQTKIIINIHQTDHHHTFEELRVLPALLCGVIVIAEESPLKENIPYHHMIVWSSYENIIQTIKDVQDNYDTYYSSLFNEESVALFNTLHQNNIRALKDALQ